MSRSGLDRFDRTLLESIQRSVPLVRRPYAQISQELALAEQAVIERIVDLRAAGVIREIAGIFDAQALAYRQALVMMRVAEDRLDAAGEVVTGHPGVSHCYGRTGRYNLWFTLAVSPRSQFGLEKTVQLLVDRCEAEVYWVLPTIKRYKLDVKFGNDENDDKSRHMAQATSPPAGTSVSATGAAPVLTEGQVKAVRGLQIDLPAESDPFATIAAQVDLTADDLLVHAADFLAAGWMRRYAAVLHHRAAGATANVLVAWQVVADMADAAGAACAAFPAVSHCYLRPAAPDWPYTLYTMIHGRSREECSATIAQVASAAGLDRREELWTATEYKKQRVKLLTDDEREWEQLFTDEMPKENIE